jgi:hypothetical protein
MLDGPGRTGTMGLVFLFGSINNCADEKLRRVKVLHREVNLIT